MKKYILGAVFSIGIIVSPAFAHQAQAAGLDSCETNAIIQLIQAFNADSNVLTSVQTSLGISTIGVDQSGNVCQPIVVSTSGNGGTQTTVVGPSFDTNKAVDVFLIAGQSNAVGYGNATQSPIPPAKKVLSFYKKTISEATDPVGNASAGSAWPAFGTAYYNATGRAIVFVPSAVPGSGQTAASDTGNGNWDTGGTLFNTSVDNVNTAMSTLSSSGYTPTFKGILWDQGENDAIAINKGFVTADEYQAALVKMIGRYRTQYGASMPFYIFQTGTSPTESDVGYAAVRAVQAQVPNIDPYTRVVFQGAAGFPSRGLMKDAYHYTQAGYNEMGKTGAQNIIVSDVVSTIPASAPTINFFTASPTSIISGQSTTLSWTSTGADTGNSCVLDANGTVGLGFKAANSSFAVSPTVTTTYNLVCGKYNPTTNSNLYSSVLHVTVTVAVAAATASAPTITNVQSLNGSITINGRFTVPSKVSLNGQTLVKYPFGVIGGDAINFNVSDFGITASGSYPVQIIDSSLGNSNIVYLNYTAPQTAVAAPTVTSSFSPSTISSTGSTVYRYDSQNTTHCVSSHPDGTEGWDNIITSASFPPTTFTAASYPNGLTTTITCYNSAGQWVASTARLTVTPPITYCTSWSYGAFGSCQSNNTQTRAVTASYPSGCTGGSPAITQGCTYVPPVVTLATPTINSFTASAYSISRGMFSMLSYSSSNISSSATCSIDNGVGSITPNTTGTKTVFPTTSTTYTLSCTGGISKTITITVSSGTISASTSSCTISAGSSSCTVNLNWTITGATNPKITNSSDSVYNNLYTSGSSGTVAGTVKTVGSTLFGIYDGVASLGSVIVSATCASGSSWVNGSCQAVPTVTSSFSPSIISPTGSTVYRYDSQNTTHCVASHPDGTGGWDNIITNASFPPTTYTASQFPNGLTTTITCYNAAGQSAVSTAILTVTNQTSSAYDAYSSASNGTKNSEMFPSQGTGDTSGFHYVWNNNLQIGSWYSADVTALQTALTKEGVYTGEISGGFYNQTFSAVKAFQQKYGIDTGTSGAGFVGLKTRAKLNTLY